MDETPQVGHHHKPIPHYYGDAVRGLFLASAIVMLIAGFTSAALPMSAPITILWIIVLVLIAGLTNPVQRGAQWLNVIVSVIGIFVFGGEALSRYHNFSAVVTSGFFLALLTLIFLMSLYFATKTLRAHILLRRLPPPHHQ